MASHAPRAKPPAASKPKSAKKAAKKAAKIPGEDLSNITPYVKKDGSVTYRIRVYDGRFKKSVSRTVTPPDDCKAGPRLEKFLVDERQKLSDSVSSGYRPMSSKISLRDYFYGGFMDTFTGRPKTWHDYEGFMKRHVFDVFGEVQMGKIDKYMMKEFTADLRRSVNPPTYNHVVTVLKIIFNSAKEDGVVIANPLEGKIGSKIKHKEDTRAMEADELRDTFAVALQQNDFWRAAMLLFIFTGCRRGELVALRWEDLDFTTSEVHFCHSTEYVAGEGVIRVAPKSPESDRWMYMPPVLVDSLKALGSEFPHGYVFCGRGGSESMMNPDSINTAISRICKRHGIRHFSPHVLRRTLVSHLNDSGEFGDKALLSILGDADVRVLYWHYLKEIKGNKKRAANKVLELLLAEEDDSDGALVGQSK